MSLVKCWQCEGRSSRVLSSNGKAVMSLVKGRQSEGKSGHARVKFCRVEVSTGDVSLGIGKDVYRNVAVMISFLSRVLARQSIYRSSIGKALLCDGTEDG